MNFILFFWLVLKITSISRKKAKCLFIFCAVTVSKIWGVIIERVFVVFLELDRSLVEKKGFIYVKLKIWNDSLKNLENIV